MKTIQVYYELLVFTGNTSFMCDTKVPYKQDQFNFNINIHRHFDEGNLRSKFTHVIQICENILFENEQKKRIMIFLKKWRSAKFSKFTNFQNIAGLKNYYAKNVCYLRFLRYHTYFSIKISQKHVLHLFSTILFDMKLT